MKNLKKMFPDEFDSALHENNAAAVLPIGSVEQHGPHLLLGCDAFIAHALAAMTAEELNAVLFPMIPFSWIGGLRPYAGTIDLRPFNTIDYLEQVCLEILGQGFGRLILINTHGGGREAVYSAARSVYNETRKPVISMYPSAVYDSFPEVLDIWKKHGVTKPGDWSSYELNELVGALSYLGYPGLASNVTENNKKALEEFGESNVTSSLPGYGAASRLGNIGHDYTHECMHVSPRRSVSIEGGIATLRFMAKKIAWAADQCV